MGSLKDEWMRRQEAERDKELANILGISYEELSQTTWEIDENRTEDDLVVNLLVVFDESSPKEILRKIKGLDTNNTVWLDSNAFSEGQYDDPDEQ